MNETIFSEKVYYIAITLAKYIGAITAKYIVDNIDDISIVFDKDKRETNNVFKFLHKKVQDSLCNPQILDEARRIFDSSFRQNINVITIKDKEYPKALRECPDAPIVLYQKGELKAETYEDMLSIVGTRNISRYGLDSLHSIMEEIANSMPNLAIVSGLAYGVDIEAHRFALKKSMPTIGVLAHGLDTIYPYTHRKDAEMILDNGGLLISEYPIGTKANRFNFVARNRIIAGMSKATMVIEAGLRSGSLITARLAVDYDRELFALPGRISDRFSEGCNQIIKEMKAQLLSSGKDILRSFSYFEYEKAIINTIKFEEDNDIDDNIYRIIKDKEPININDIALISGEDMQSLTSKLFDLELDGYIQSMPGGLYILSK